MPIRQLEIRMNEKERDTFFEHLEREKKWKYLQQYLVPNDREHHLQLLKCLFNIQIILLCYSFIMILYSDNDGE
jgi:hypothetical protein